ncbi:formylglycine-generating enzyme required for sulfatase activity [Spinactinospora alkalitolerans]|uniref:Formylglycine-generating enzyme required for sulfatase activity n=1 Tax=Spinactinospora alkalitolerans TaxID=687207 RepID=A0A852U3N6_9ACTN|nr:SUMF1/EgtB/PvdO family nonheme iron enzyme [Spinactinospora alkalitolerans]NYE50801.1 formylglycine-generating enzyme required for sulfatase activity [Spinactinospora alkalitolerans]
MSAPTIQLWSGREVRALREAKRMSIRAFAAHLGVSERMVSKWEKNGEDIHPRPVNQQALDSSLAASSADVQARFENLVGPATATAREEHPEQAAKQEPAPPSLNEPHQVRHPVDGKLMTLVEAGVYLSGEGNESVYLPAFYIDVFPTTNADYSRFLAATGHPAPQHWENATPPADLYDHPVVFVTWKDAAAYASWAAKSLPASRQWEKAARGTRGDVYPWGSQRTPAKCNVRESQLRSTTPVSRYHSGVSPYGVYDMCGNIWEWCSTESEPGRYELKGSAFTSPFFRATPSNFNDASTEMLDDDTGFRCVTPSETMQALLKLNT